MKNQGTLQSKELAKELVLLGGGHAHSLLLKMVGMQPLKGVQVTLISDVTLTPYSGMLPGHIAGFYSHEEAHIDLRKLSAFAKARFVLAKASGVDLQNKRVLLESRPPMSFDLLSINVGSTPWMENVVGVGEFAIPAKPVPVLLEAWQRVINKHATKRPLTLTIVGGGAGGVELALCMHARLLGDVKINLIHQSSEILATHNKRVRHIMTGLLKNRGINLVLNQRVTEVTRNSVLTAAGTTLPTDYTFWITHASPPSWLKGSALVLTEKGFIEVTQTLQAKKHPFVFAVGDVATMEGFPRPKAGVFSVRQAKPLLENIRRHLENKPLISYKPQREILGLIGTGQGQAVASRKRLALLSRTMWILKNHIDKKFMGQFKDLPAPPEEPDRPIRCMGCAAKIGSDVLNSALSRMKKERSTKAGDILIGLDAAEDAAVFDVPSAQSLVQSVDYFPSLVSDPYVFGRIMANHGFSDISAMGARPHSALALALVPLGASHVMEESLYQMLSGVVHSLDEMGAALLGGHSAEAPALAMGLMCNGLADKMKIMRKGSLRPGDALILTKALGTGTLFAAEMRQKAQGAWIDSAIESMLQSNLQASECFLNFETKACTDITGFGLAGHLLEMLKASRVGAQINLESIPILPGARETLDRGIFSTLDPSNRNTVAFIKNGDKLPRSSSFSVLFDPQTSGGLLAGVAPERAEDCIESLKKLGFTASTVIGQVIEGNDAELIRLSK